MSEPIVLISNQRIKDGLGAVWSNRGTLIAFVLLVLVGGSNVVAVRFSNLELPPFWGAAIRFAAAALIFWIIVLVQRIALPKGRALTGALLYGFLTIGASYAFVYWGLLRVQAGLTIVVLAFVPLMTLFFALAHGLETFRWRGLIGALISIAGILLAVGGGLGTAVPVASLLALVAGAACTAEGSVVFKLFPKSDPVATNALALTTGASLLIGLSLVAGEEWNLPTGSNTWAAFSYLVLIGSVALFYLYLYVLAQWTASATAYCFLLFPVATVVIAAWLAGEVVTTSFVIGGGLVLAGVGVGAIGGPSRAASSDRSPTTQKVIS
jgi:drug/metabolite transporter (DMT)-like permease